MGLNFLGEGAEGSLGEVERERLTALNTLGLRSTSTAGEDDVDDAAFVGAYQRCQLQVGNTLKRGVAHLVVVVRLHNELI